MADKTGKKILPRTIYFMMAISVEFVDNVSSVTQARILDKY